MATLTLSRAPLSFFDRLSAGATDMRARYTRYRVYRTTLNELQDLSQRELDDLGIHPTAIKSIAYEAAYKI